jgi:hypothetical protein
MKFKHENGDSKLENTGFTTAPARPFEPDAVKREASKLRPSEFERAWDEMHQSLKEMGIKPQEIYDLLGREVAFGVLDFSAEGETLDIEDTFESNWYIIVETKGDVQAIKKKFTDFVAKDGKGRETLRSRQLEGGEILFFDTPEASPLFFTCGTFTGFTMNIEVARRLLQSASGRGTLSGRIPGAAGGSKFAYFDIAKLVQAMSAPRFWRHEGGTAEPYRFNIARAFPKGLRISASTEEGAAIIGLRLQTAGESSALSILNEAYEALLMNENLKRHDRRVAESLADALRDWHRANLADLRGLSAEDQLKRLKSVTPESLAKGGTLAAHDGLRLCSDPAMKPRIEAMIKARRDFLGDKDGRIANGDISEHGFEWFGLSPFLPAPVDPDAREEEFEKRIYYDGTSGWLVAMARHPLGNARLVIVQNGSEFGVRYVTEDAVQQLRRANSAGRELVRYTRMLGKIPKWKVPATIRRYRWGLTSAAYRVAQALERDPNLVVDFKGASHDDPNAALAKMLGEDGAGVDYGSESFLLAKIEIRVENSRIIVKWVEDGFWVEYSMPLAGQEGRETWRSSLQED